jgi:transcriptional regulator with XRE-family HTH domain
MPSYRVPTGRLLRSLRPATYRQIVDFLAEPREHVSYREIARVCRVGGSTIKAIERVEAVSISERKAKMLRQVTRVAERAWRTVEDKLDDANLAQATICAGVATDKMLLLAGEPACRMEVNLRSADIHSEFLRLQAEIRDALRDTPPPPLLSVVDAEVVESRPVSES